MATKFGVIGLGRIGGGLARQALGKGYEVVGRDTHFVDPSLTAAGLEVAETLADLVARLPRPRKIFLYIHAGPAIDAMLAELAAVLEPGDVVIDGGNSYWGDSLRRAKEMRAKELHLIDLGTSGGLSGANNGACFMAGGDPEAVAQIEPILRDLAVEGGYVYAGPSGSGHFVKLVHNGIEFGMLQAIGEGIDLLERYDTELPVADILSCWRNGSVVRSWLIDLMHEAYVAHPAMSDVPGYIEDTGEVNWLVADAMRMEVPIPVISQSVMQLFTSRDDTRNWAKAVALMRHGFGGHPFGREASLIEERQTSRVGDIHRPGSDV